MFYGDQHQHLHKLHFIWGCLNYTCFYFEVIVNLKGSLWVQVQLMQESVLQFSRWRCQHHEIY